MQKAYKILAYLVAFEVMVQATMIAWAVFGLHNWIVEGNTVTKEMVECRDCPWNFAAERGFMVHGLNGQMIIPLLAVILFILAFFAKIPGGVVWAGIVLVLVIIQVFVLAELGTESAYIGGLHGLNALVLFATAAMAGVRVKRAVAEAA